MPKVSIIMPVLNSISYIRECMDSVIGQTLKDIEILPVDAGSTDGTREVLEEYARTNSRVRIIHSDRKSAGYQYNLGIEEACGDYIGFVESDDFIMPEMYEKLLEYAVKFGVDWVKANHFCFMDYPRVGKQLIPVKNRKFCPIGTVFSPGLFSRQYTREMFMWQGIYKTEFVRKNQIRLNETPGASFQDTGFILQAFMYATKALYIDDYLYCYRRDNQGSSSNQRDTIRYEFSEAEYISKIIKADPELCEKFGEVNYIRSLERFISAYERVPEIIGCPKALLYIVRCYRNYLLKELEENPGFEAACLVSEHQKELIWLKAGLEIFDARYRELDSANENMLRNMVGKVIGQKKVMVFGCGDNGSGMVSLLLRLNRNEIVCFSDNDESKWNKKYMGVQVVPPDLLKVDADTVVLVANKENFYEIRAQLMGLGISEKQIWLCPQVMRFRGTNLLPEGDILPSK